MIDSLVHKGYNIRGVEIFDTGYDPGSAYAENRQRTVLPTKEFINAAKQKLQSVSDKQQVL
jgi:hypothetical protein